MRNGYNYHYYLKRQEDMLVQNLGGTLDQLGDILDQLIEDKQGPQL